MNILLLEQAVIAQEKLSSPSTIKGIIIGRKSLKNSIYFIPGDITKKYFEKPLLQSKVISNKFIIINKVHYPQMYKIIFTSDKGNFACRSGDFFIDSTTRNISIDYNFEECNNVIGATANEYHSKFIPFATNGINYDCKSNYLSDLFYNSNNKADSILLKYVKTYPNSYVALWKLIERFSEYGQSLIRQQALTSFSNEIKQTKIWSTLSRDFKGARIKEGDVFPDISLKTIDLKPTKIILPKAKFILIDFWFARCRPCLDTIPVLKKLYNDYKKKGLEVVSISVDETVNVPIWQKRIKEHSLNWVQYLEENNFRSNELGIKSYPTFFLLDDKGIVINKDFDLHYLDRYLNKNL